MDIWNLELDHDVFSCSNLIYTPLSPVIFISASYIGYPETALGWQPARSININIYIYFKNVQVETTLTRGESHILIRDVLENPF